MSDTRTPNEIERDIEQERARLGQTVDALQDRFSPERILRDVGRGFSEHGGDIGTAITQSVKRNPVALALTGIGLAWLMSGKSWDETRDGVKDGVRAARDRMPDAPWKGRGSGEAALSYAAPGAGDHDDTPPTPAGRARPAPTDSVGMDHPLEDDWLWAEDDDYWDDETDDDAATNAGPGIGTRVGDMASSAGEAVSGAGSSVAGAAKSAASGIGAGVSSAADGLASGAASARDAAAAAGRSTAERARRIRKRLAKGTENFTEEARERVIAARWAAIKAQKAVRRRARKGADAASDFYEQNPLVVGGLALAAGAILAGALPRTRQEDRAFGAYSDEAFDKAERIFHAERRKATRVAERALDTAKEVADEKREQIDASAPGSKSAAEHLADQVREGAERVVSAATDEADRQKLGKPG
ncbi:DUF3618 domain-containing protein [Oceanicola sp. 502str15]|uniref:DUF3618 domain-containing protein n=1 Tax=Oceanicola sp. 502str15 TaxID=2696061 RepID=UPI00209596D9|nr:DUF3618 domain-containing protein [Oceanicola sp. 502str15]MCO6383352.1 DUF3618 domain-containing protein [Oceanicola sp. 502str15]